MISNVNECDSLRWLWKDKSLLGIIRMIIKNHELLLGVLTKKKKKRRFTLMADVVVAVAVVVVVVVAMQSGDCEGTTASA